MGNRLSQSLLDGNLPNGAGVPSLTISTASNRITTPGYTYDGVGDMLHDAVSAYTYDGANRLTTVNGTGAAYTYFGPLRIKKVVGATTTLYIYSGSKPIVEYVNGSLSREYIYAGSQLLATITPTGTTYHHPDHISDRAETDASGNVVRTFGHLPYGELWYEPTGTDKDKFTSYERDSETGLDYAMFRQYGSGQGRFMSVDLLGGHTGVPQSMNRYGYVGNDPINFIDPLGLTTIFAISGNCIYTFESTATTKDDHSVEVHAGALTLYFCFPGASNGSSPDFGNGPGGGAPGGGLPGNLSWWKTFAKEFFKFSGGPGNVPTCAGQTLRSIGEELAGGTTESEAAVTSFKAASVYQTGKALQYAATRTNSLGGTGLICPSCSSVFRSMMSKAEFLGDVSEAVPLIDTSLDAGKSIPGVSEQARNGECAAAFPIF